MVIKKFLRREAGIVYKYLRVTTRYTDKAKKALKTEAEGYFLMEFAAYGTDKVQITYRREFNDFGGK